MKTEKPAVHVPWIADPVLPCVGMVSAILLKVAVHAPMIVAVALRSAVTLSVKKAKVAPVAEGTVEYVPGVEMKHVLKQKTAALVRRIAKIHYAPIVVVMAIALEPSPAKTVPPIAVHVNCAGMGSVPSVKTALTAKRTVGIVPQVAGMEYVHIQKVVQVVVPTVAYVLPCVGMDTAMVLKIVLPA